MMFFYTIFIFTCVLMISAKNAEQQIVHIRVDEELPISTILFTTSPTITYRLFDSGRNQNSFVRYDSSTGQLHLARALDREYLCSQHICSCSQCQLQIELIEWQLPYRLLQLILNIDDINDHRPEFSSNIYQFNLMENVPIGYELSLEQAYDADWGENSRISYDLRRLDENLSDGPFELMTKNNGGLTLKVKSEIDREERDHYEYELIAFDHGQPRKQSSVKLYIEIEDMNDNPVLLADTHLRLNISELTPVGTKLTSINASDRDIGINGKIFYSISHGLPASSWMDHFRIGESTGILTLVGPLDYETEQSYRLTVQVRDLGENSLAHFMTIDIYVIDENDNRPQASVTFVESIANDSQVYLRENTPVGQILAHVSISDQDSGSNGQMTYRIEQENGLIGIKSIDQRSFLLVVDRLIDREEIPFETDQFTLVITDHGEPAQVLRLTYSIYLVDENDSPPIFDQSINCNVQIEFKVNQSLEFHQPLFQVSARDLDQGENGLVSYSILPPYEHIFRINEQGQVYYSVGVNHSSTYHLCIMAMDHGKPTRLNSTYDCSISVVNQRNIRPDFNAIDGNDQEMNSSMDTFSLMPSKKLFQWTLAIFDHYSFIFLGLFILFVFIILTLITICITSCLHALFFSHRKKIKHKPSYHSAKQYDFYDPIHRKSPFTHDDSACSSKLDDHDDLTSEERERLVHSASDQTSCESSDSMNKQIRAPNQNSMLRPLSDHQHFSRTIRNSYPPSPYLSSMASVSIPPPKPPRESSYESSTLFQPAQHQQSMSGRPLSLSISTATTYTSSVTDSSSSPLPPAAPSMNTFRPHYSSFRNQFAANHVVRLAEEEKMDV